MSVHPAACDLERSVINHINYLTTYIQPQPKNLDIMANEDDRTYVWVRNSALRSSCGVSSTNDEHETNKKEKSSNNASTKKRGTSEEEKTWEWCLAFYRSEQVRGRSLHHYSLIPRSRDEQAPDSGICTIDESRTNSLYESGDLFPANDWEVFGLNGNHDEEKLRNGDSNDDAASVTNRRETSYLIHKPVNKTTDNLIDLAHLNEPSVVNALRNRHQQSQLDATKMYTYSGDILLAVNPFRNDEAIKIYNESYAEQYRKEGERCWWEKRQGGNDINDRERMEKTEEILGPHVFGVADRIFRTMMTRLHPMTSIGDFRVKGNTDLGMTKNTDKINLSVLVSGDSGAGKTVTTKLLLGYLSKLCYRSPNFALSFTQTREDIPPEQTLLKYNQILESFGNARTARNDNSSRFGKYTEMRFSAIHDGVHIGGRCTSNTSERTGKSIHSSLGATLVGTRIETYLLERVRLVRQSRDERNYHIFYELCTLKNESNKCDNFDDSYSRQQLVSKFGLSEYGMEDFSLINSSGTYHRRDGVSDASTFAKLCDAMTATGFKKEEQVDVFALIAALLHLSNLTFSENEDGVITLQNSPHLDYVEDLLGLPATRLSGTLCQQHILVNGKVLSKAFTVEDAKKGVDSLIKGLYVAMFDGLVERINASLEGEQMGKESDASIGILDIFGFESFPRNSFEQLCINTCNEALQRQFNRSVIVSEQVEYKREGIPWNDVELLDNDDVVKLIENDIFSVLNDQCKLRNSTDASFLKALLNRSSTERIQASSLQVSSRLFEVKHYAGLVEYSVEGMLEKNRDKLSVTGCELLLSSSNGFVKTIGEALTSISKGRSSRKSSISNEFIVQLQVLTCKIDESSPHCEFYLLKDPLFSHYFLKCCIF
jgi:myosin-5